MPITENTHNQQTIKAMKKNENGADPEVNKIVPCGKKVGKNVSCATQSWYGACYAKQNINLVCPYTTSLANLIELSNFYSTWNH